ncbi:MAG TPA: kelch repeat-containing protein [Candidatus Dormibacteraeota bacterium]|nr:kelch repeat-containing protein [Candidatus Dormibacteraeota bacterium]
MSDRTKNRINAAFENELSTAPVPAGLRALSIRDAVAATPRRAVQPQLLVVIATIVVIAVVATFVIGSHVLRSTPLPAKPIGSTVPPVPRTDAAVAYDQAHGSMVVFGGNAQNGRPATNETWTWDGKFWTQHHPAASPTPRLNAVMAYDAVDHDVVLFGGVENVVSSGKGGMTTVDDTWTWDGSQWRQLHPVHYPVLGFDFPATMQFDPVSRTVLLFGFTQSHTEAMTDIEAQTWLWNGSDWTQMHPSGGPTTSGVMVSDGEGLMMLAPTKAPIAGRNWTQLWAWDGSSWTVVHDKLDLPFVGGYMDAAYDPTLRQLVVIGGEVRMADTWTWDGSSWSRQHPAVQPFSPGYMAYVPSLKRVVSWGDRYLPDDNEMFAWDGTNWSVIQPGTVVSSGATNKGVITTRMTPEQAASLVRSTVKNTHPALLPVSLPSSGGPWDAFVQVTADDFNITYESDMRDETITICICVANPPPATGPNAQVTRVKFRKAVGLKYSPDGYAEHGVYDMSAPASQRYLQWNEPGSMTNPMSGGSMVPYYVSSTGLTEQEFWQVANSLQ